MIKKFFKDSFIYSLSNVLVKGISFLLLPLYLQYLSKEEYGVYDYIAVIGSILGVVVTLEISQAVVRFVTLHKAWSESAIYIKSSVISVLALYSVFFVFVFGFSEDISFFITGEKGNSLLVIVGALNYFSMSMLYLTIVIDRSFLKSRNVAISSVLSALIVAVLSFLFLRILEFGVLSLLFANFIGQTTVFVFNLIRYREYLKVPIEVNKVLEMLRFSTPLVFSSLGVMFSLYVDRIMVKEFMGVEMLAEYGLAARISSLATLIVFGFQSSLSPLIYNNFESKGFKRNMIILFLFFTVVSVFLVLFSMFFSGVLMAFLGGDGYFFVSSIVPVMIASILISSAYIFFPGVSIVKKTSILSYINMFSAILNAALNFYAIPNYGLQGAAFATLLSAVICFFLNAYFSEKHYPIYTRIGGIK